MSRERVTLVYMPGRGIADAIRLLLEVGGWTWDEYNPDSREDFLALKAETVHGTIPFVRIHEGETMRTLEQVPRSSGTWRCAQGCILSRSTNSTGRICCAVSCVTSRFPSEWPGSLPTQPRE